MTWRNLLTGAAWLRERAANFNRMADEMEIIFDLKTPQQRLWHHEWRQFQRRPFLLPSPKRKENNGE